MQTHVMQAELYPAHSSRAVFFLCSGAGLALEFGRLEGIVSLPVWLAPLIQLCPDVQPGLGHRSQVRMLFTYHAQQRSTVVQNFQQRGQRRIELSGVRNGL